MSPNIRQWIPSPKYILTSISYDPKSKSGFFRNAKFYYFSVKEKLVKTLHFLHFETLEYLITNFVERLTKTNFEFRTFLIL